MDSVPLTSAETVASWPATRVLGLTTQQSRRLVLTLALVVAAAFRVTALATYGFSEDEVNKLRAIAAYERGDLIANAEHPMLMKLAMWGSLAAADAWNGTFGTTRAIAPETALRLPNALAGVATVAAVYGVSTLLLGPPVAALAALLVALDPNVTAINRIGKEDTFLLLFFLLAVWCYERGKRIGAHDAAAGQPWYTLAGACFGLMLASKYMPHFLGLYALFNVIAQPEPGENKPHRGRYYGAMALAFIAANFVVLHPDTWKYCVAYLQGVGLQHHGYPYAQQIYVTDVPISSLGVPPTYYLHLFVTKVPLAVLAAAVVALVPLIRHRRTRGVIWLRVMLLLLIVPYSLMAAKFQRYALPMLVLLDILAALGAAALVEWVWRQHAGTAARVASAAAVIGVLVGAQLADQRRAAPFYSLHQNAVGARLAAPGTIFPEESYDYGVREAVRAITRSAAPGALILSDADGVVAHYVARSGRKDIEARSLSGHGPDGRRRERWIVVQDAHRYFENSGVIDDLRRGFRPWREYSVRGTPVVQVFRLAP